MIAPTMQVFLLHLFSFLWFSSEVQGDAYGIRIKQDDEFDTFSNLTAQDIPASFDARTRWPMCKTIPRIRDQGKCASCWAIVASSVMSDRYCVLAHRPNVIVSSADLVNCCEECASNGDGCQGGQSYDAFNYWSAHGVVTESCLRYYGRKESCSKECDTKKWEYKTDLNFGARGYDLNQNVTEIQLDIMVNGPVAAGVTVGQDFFEYKGGIYRHHEDSPMIGAHSVRLVGWGVEDGVDYWLAANSWGTGWGDNGFIKILRGVNHMQIETYVTAGVPKICDFKECATPKTIAVKDIPRLDTGSVMISELMP